MAPTPKTPITNGMPVYNVCDYGAVGDGTTDDLPAYNKCIAACVGAGGGRVYTPARPGGWSGTAWGPQGFRVSGPIDANQGRPDPAFGPAPLEFMGDGSINANGSNILGDFPDDILKSPYQGQAANLRAITGVGFNNAHLQGSCASIGDSTVPLVSRCKFMAHKIGLSTVGAFGIQIHNTQFVAAKQDSGIGAMVVQGSLYDCEFTNWGEGVRAYQSAHIAGGHYEVNHIAIRLGTDENGNRAQLTGGIVDTIAFERNDTAIFIDVIASCRIMCNALTGTIGPAWDKPATGKYANGVETVTTAEPHGFQTGVQKSLITYCAAGSLCKLCDVTGAKTYTFKHPSDPGAVTTYGAPISNGIFVAGSIADSIIGPNAYGGWYSNAAVDIENAGLFGVRFEREIAISNGTGVGFKMPPVHVRPGVRFVDCNNPINSFPFLFLPGQPGNTGQKPMINEEQWVTDCTSNNWGDIITVGGGQQVLACLRWTGQHWSVIAR